MGSLLDNKQVDVIKKILQENTTITDRNEFDKSR